MDFFERQERARRRSGWLVAYFVLAVVLIIAAIYLIFAVIFLPERPAGARELADFWHTELFLGVAAGICAVVIIGSVARTLALRRGGAAVAELLGGRRVSSDTADPDERQLLNVVEEMAIASGMTVPPVYVMDQERAINAFAAGHSVNDAVIGVTRGTIELLSRDELQGVVAHEFSHILNGDMRLNLRLMGVLFGILCIAIIGRVLLRASFAGRVHRMGARRGRGGGNPLPLIGIALMIVGSIGVFFGRLIKSAVSRQREYLADASAVQFTRNPAGIAGALIKIGGLQAGSKLETPRAEEASHLFFSNGLNAGLMGLLATHPPLVERIRAIDPSFDGKFPAVKPPASRTEAKPQTRPARPGVFSAPRAGLAGLTALEPTRALRETGAPTPAHLQAAAAWLQSLPEALVTAVHDPARARHVIYALLLSEDSALRSRQLNLLPGDGPGSVRGATQALYPLTSALDRGARLPLAELCMSALREMSREQYPQFRRAVKELIEADRSIDLFEFAVQKCLERHLAPSFEGTSGGRVRHHNPKAVMREFSTLLTLLSNVGTPLDEGRARAYGAAVAALGMTPESLPPARPEDANLEAADRALSRLSEASPILKKRFLQACAHAVASDGVIHPQEAELLRAVADALDCPIPPFLEADLAQKAAPGRDL